MRAWRVHRLGPPSEVLQLELCDPPEPGPGEVVVAVEAAALNFADGLLCEGRYQERPALPFTPGVEVAGVVVAHGPGVGDGAPAVGDPVIALARLGVGGFTARTVAAVPDVFTRPASMPVAVAAALPVTYQTAWVALLHRAGLAAGQTVLVHAGAGGAGSAAIQVARAAGATVIATAGGAGKVARCRDLGAHLAIDHRHADFVEVVREHTGGAGVDVVYDGVGGDTFDASTKVVAFEGRIVVVGFSGGRIAEARTNHAMVKNYSVIGVNWGAYRTRRPELLQEAHRALMVWWEEGRISPLVSEVVPMAALPDALERLRAGATVGKVVVDITR